MPETTGLIICSRYQFYLFIFKSLAIMKHKLNKGTRIKVKSSGLAGIIVYQKHLRYGVLLDNEIRPATIVGQPAATFEYMKRDLELILNNNILNN